MSQATKRSNGCPSETDLYQFATGKLSSEALEEIAEHVGNCQACLERMERLEDKVVNGSSVQGSWVRESSNVEREQGFLDLMNSLKRTDPDDIGSISVEGPSTPYYSENDGRNSLGQYDLGTMLGEGAMGTVYRGWHRLLKRDVVIKMLSPNRRTDRLSVARFIREIEAVGRIGNHPHIMRTIDAGEHEGNYYIVMEFVEGADLRKISTRGRITPCDVAEIGRQISLALAHMNEHKIVHRDVKPSNIFLSQNGVAMVLDLGLALFRRRADDSGGRSHVVGTSDYMAPEQWVPGKAIDTRADIYSLGCTLYQLISGSPPFGEYRGFVQKRDAHLRVDPEFLRDRHPHIPRGLAEIINRMLAKEPACRYRHAHEICDALQPFATGSDLETLVRNGLPSSEDTKSQIGDPTNIDYSVPSIASGVRRWNRRVAMVTLLGLGAAAAGAATLIPRKPVSLEVPDSEPDFHRLFGTGSNQDETYHYSAAQRTLTASSSGLLGIAWKSPLLKPNFSLSVNIGKEADECTAGVFWGAGAVRFEGSDACYQSVLSVHRNSQAPAALTIRHAELGISNTELQSTQVFENPAIREATMHLAADTSWIRLFIRVDEGRIVESRCNDIALPALVTDLASSNTAGPGHCGVFVRHGSATFSDFTLSPHAPAAST